jgi:acyl-CoA synthetase (AMP-forming)/AMP-acid ligase II
MNIALVLDLAAEGMPDRMAWGSADGLTYAELRRCADHLAVGLRERDVTILARSHPCDANTPVALFGSAWAGVSYAPLNDRLPAQARRALVERLGPGTVMFDDLVDLDLFDPGREQPSSYEPEPDRAAVVLYTSGTTAAPKAALLAHDNLLAYLFNTVEFGGAAPEEAMLLTVPPFHIAGVTSVLSNVYAGRRIVVLPRFTPEAWIDRVRGEHISHAFVVPTMLARIVATLDATPGLQAPPLRHLAYGGSRMPAPVLERALELFPDTDFVNGYGLTETSSTVCVLGPADHRTASASPDADIHRRLQSVGRPVPGVEIRVIDDEIQVRGAQVAGSYTDWTKVEPDGWLPTGDLGFVDDDGFVFISGRADDVIIAGGENIAPEEIEDVLLRHPAIQAAAVVGVADQEWGERPAAMVVLSSPQDQAMLLDWVRERLGGLKTPVALVVEAELPVTPTGKVIRRAVKQSLDAAVKSV